MITAPTPAHKADEQDETITYLYQQIAELKSLVQRMELSRHESGLNQIALKVAEQIEDLFAQDHRGGRIQRLAKMQVIIREAMRANLKGETDWRYPNSARNIREPEV